MPNIRTPVQPSLELAGDHRAEIGLLRTKLQFAQTSEVRLKAMERLRELGADPTQREREVK